MRPPSRSAVIPFLILVAALALWALDVSRDVALPSPKSGTPSSNAAPDSTSNRKPTSPSGRYEIFDDCTLAEDRGNDGDSFRVKLPGGKTEIFRLYFVDTPESAFKRYAGGDSNHERIRQQAADMGGITPEQAVEIGKKAKAFTLGLLESAPFTILTEWDSPYNDQRYHAFVEVNDHGKHRWLHELLVERGLARIKTKPADLPDGTPSSRYREHLRELERKARKSEVGAWGF